MCVTIFRLVGGEVTGRCSKNLVLSLKLPSSTWVGLYFLLKNSKMYCYYISLDEKLGLCFIRALLFLDCSSFVSAFPHFPISNCLNWPFGTQGRSRRLKPFSYKQETGTRKVFCTQEGPTGSCSISQWNVLICAVLSCSRFHRSAELPLFLTVRLPQLLLPAVAPHSSPGIKKLSMTTCRLYHLQHILWPHWNYSTALP